MADAEPTPLVSQEMLDNAPTEEELRLPTNDELIAKQDENGDGSDNKDGEGSSDAGDAGGAADEGGNSDSDEPPETPTPETPAEAVEYIDDPGEFTPGDYAFEVTVYDEEGKNGKLHKIATLDAWDTLLETEPNLGSSAAVLRAERSAQKMDRGIERDRLEFDRQKTEYDQAVEAQQKMDSTTLQWQQELDYLVNKGELPPMPPEYHVSKADWKNPTVAKQPAVKAQMDLLAYFRAENAERAKAGLQPMQSLLDAYNGYAREQEKAAAKDNKQAASQARRTAAGRVATSAPKPATTAPRGVAVGRIGVL